MPRVHPVLALLAAFLVAGPILREATAADAIPDLLAAAPENRLWWSPPGAFVTVYQPDQDSEPVLVFRKEALRRLAITLDVSSDAKGLHLVSGSSDMDLRITPKGRDSIVLDMASSPPKLTFNGDKLAHFQKAWAWMAKDDRAPNLALRFDGATKVAITAVDAGANKIALKIPQVAGPAGASTARSPTTPVAPDRLSPRTKIDAMVMQAQQGVFRLRVEMENKGIYVLATAFSLTEDGFAATSFHTLKGATGAWALLGEDATPVPVQLWSVKPSMNLALLKIDTEALPGTTRIHPIPVIPEDAEKGSDVWALGLDRYGDPIVTAGSVIEHLPYTKLVTEVRDALGFDNLSHWVQVSAAIDINNSGGPLLDEEGRLVGLNTWVWPNQASNTSSSSRSSYSRSRSSSSRSPVAKYYALNAGHVLSLVQQRPAEPLGFEKARSRYGLSRSPNTALPRIQVRPFHPRQLRQSANTFRIQSICPLCKGEGEIENPKYKEENEDEENERDQFQREINERNRANSGRGSSGRSSSGRTSSGKGDAEEEEPFKECPRCQGHGFNRAETVFRLGSHMVEVLAGLNHADTAVQDALVYAHEKLFEVVEHNPQRLVRAVNAQARRQLHRTSLKLGTPVLLLGMVDSNSGLPPKTKELTRVRVGETGPDVLLAEPNVADAKAEGIVLIGGILSGYLDDVTATPIPVMHHGFIINLPDVEEEDSARPGSPRGLPGQSGAASAEAERKRRMEMWRRWMEAREAGGR